MATFVLVHGGFHGAWCYSRVAARLRAKMHDIYTPTLSGIGERAHLAGQAINLSTHVQDIVNLISFHDLRDVILCGHSYGGMVITGVAGQIGERIRTLVYLDAAVPENNQSLFDIIGAERARLALDAAGDTGIMMVPPGADVFQVNSRDVKWVDRLCTPHPIACFIQKLRYTGKEALVKYRTYVLAERYQMANRATCARLKDLPGWRLASLESGHDMMIDAPEELVSVLLEEVQR